MSKFVCTITPNPALDLGGQVDDLILNEKSYVFNVTNFPGGNAINAARILTRLKIPVLSTGFLDNNVGETIRELLKQESVKTNFITISGQTRINITVSNIKDHNQTRLTFPGPHISQSEKKQLFDLVKKQNNISHLVIGGSLPPGFSPVDVVQLAKIARSKGVETIIDCPGKILKQILMARPLLIKPNLLEFQELTGTKVRSISAVIREAKKLLPKVSMICISSVNGGTLLVTTEAIYFGRIAKVKIRSTVGAGDSMVGAMMAQLFHKKSSPDELLRWGLAAAAATLSETGTTLGSRKKILALYRKTKVERINT